MQALQIAEKIKELAPLYQEVRMDTKGRKKLKKPLLKHHTPKQIDIFHECQINPSDIQTGVRRNLPMIYHWGVWICPVCSCRSKDAHLTDYFCLYPSTTNSQCKDFLHLPTRHVARKILISSDLPATSNPKSRIYFSKKV